MTTFTWSFGPEFLGEDDEFAQFGFNVVAGDVITINILSAGQYLSEADGQASGAITLTGPGLDDAQFAGGQVFYGSSEDDQGIVSYESATSETLTFGQPGPSGLINVHEQFPDGSSDDFTVSEAGGFIQLGVQADSGIHGSDPPRGPEMVIGSVTVSNDSRFAAPHLPPRFTADQKAAFQKAATDLSKLSTGLSALDPDPKSVPMAAITALAPGLASAIDPQVGFVNSVIQTGLSVAGPILSVALEGTPAAIIAATIGAAAAIDGLASNLFQALANDPPDGNYTEVYRAPNWTLTSIPGGSAVDNAVVGDSFKLLQDAANLLAAGERFQGADLAGDDASKALQETAFDAALEQYSQHRLAMSNDLGAFLTELEADFTDVDLQNDQTLAKAQSYLSGLANPATDDPFISNWVTSTEGFAPVNFFVGADVQQALNAVANEQPSGLTGSDFALIGQLASDLSPLPQLSPLANEIVEATSPAGAAVPFSATATDVVDGTDPVIFTEGDATVHSGDTFGLGSHVITASATNSAGNTGVEHFTIAIVNGTVLTANPGEYDTLIGNSLEDTFVVFDDSDTVVPLAGSHDVVYAAGSYTLPSRVDVLFLEGNATSGAGNSDAAGDALYAANPLGAATLTGNSANDAFVVYSSSDVVVPKAGSHDVVYAAASYALPTGVDVLLLEAGTQAVGNSDAAGDALYAANAGIAQTLIGNSGNDTFVVYNPADVVVPMAGSHDIVYSAVNYTLPTGVDTLFLEAGTQAVGNSDAAGDVLYAADAAIAQTLTGHSHNDTFAVYNSADAVVGQAGSTDTVYTAANFTLPTNVDTLFLEGNSATQGTGNNDAVNTLFGNAGVASTLVAGSGADTLYVTGTAGTLLTGGAGHDTFAFPDAMGHDEVTNFDIAKDTLQFNASLFSNFTAAMNAASQVGTDTVFAIDANDTVTLDNVTKASLVASNFHFT